MLTMNCAASLRREQEIPCIQRGMDGRQLDPCDATKSQESNSKHLIEIKAAPYPLGLKVAGAAT